LWCRGQTVTPQAMSQGFLSFPAELFERVFTNLLPSLKTAWLKRNQRPLPESIQFTLGKFSGIWIVDSCDALSIVLSAQKPRRFTPRAVGRKNGNSHRFNDQATRPEADFLKIKRASDINLEKNIRQLVAAKTLLLLDRGCDHFSFWRQLIEQEIHFINRFKKGPSIKCEQVFTNSYESRDSLIPLGSGTSKTPFIT